MNIIKTTILGLMLAVVIATIGLNSLVVDVASPPEAYSDCRQFYYHPTFTYPKISRTAAVDKIFWITTDGRTIEELMAMPGMKITLSKDGDAGYKLTGKDAKYTYGTVNDAEAELLQDQISGLKVDGDEVKIDAFIGYIDEQLTVIDNGDMLGAASACKETR